jgi:hypothetical protein
VIAWSFDNFTFTTAPTSGHYILANDVDGAGSNGPLTIEMNNPSPASPGSFVQQVNGALVNWPGTAGGVVKTWTGAISTDWIDPGNWSPTGVPGASDSVVIPQTSLAPTDTASASTAYATSIGSLVITGNLSLTLDGGMALYISRTLNTGSGSIEKGQRTGSPVVVLAGAGAVQGNINATISLTGTYRLSDSLSSSAGVFVFGSLDLNSKKMTVDTFTTASNGILVMTHPTDTLRVVGPANFAGGSTSGKLIDGAILVGGDFTEVGTAVGDAFAPSGNHWTFLSGTSTQQVSFLHPGSGAGTSRFMNLGITNQVTGAITVNTDLYILGQSAFDPTVPVQAVTGNGSVVHLANLFIQDPITFDNVLLAYDAALGGSDSISITNATFVNFDPNGATPVISISHPGALDPGSGGVMTYFFTNLTFGTVIGSGTGTYLSATDTNTGNGAPLQIFITSNLNNPEGPNHTVTQGGAQVTWSVP